MIEPELAFADLHDDMACATAYLQYVVGYFSQPFPFLYSVSLPFSFPLSNTHGYFFKLGEIHS